MKKFDIIVVGGGLVGYAFALDLAKVRPQFSIAIIEVKKPIFRDIDNAISLFKKDCQPGVIPRATHSKETSFESSLYGNEGMMENDSLDSRIYAIAPDNVAYLKKNGVRLDKLRHGIINTMDVSGDINSNIILDKNSTHNQFLAKTLEYKILQKELYHQISLLDNVNLIYDSITKIEVEDARANLTGVDDNYNTKLLVGADGASSFVRKESALDAKLIDYNQFGVVANFSSELPHKNIAYQWFKDGEILAYLPLSNNNISIVWSCNNPRKLLEMSEEDFTTTVSAFGGYKLGKLKILTKPVAFPLRMYLLEKIYAKRVVLIGDAAHTIHPLAGQGVNLGFRDAKKLVQVLSKLEPYQLGEIDVLAKYNVERQIMVKEMQLTCHILHRLFASNNEVIKVLRNQGLNWVNKLPFLKKALMNIAT